MFSPLEIGLICSLFLGGGYAGVKKLVKKDTEVEDRRRGAANLAGVLKSTGLKKIPDFLISYSVGDYSGMANDIKDLAKLFLDGEAAVLAEFKDVFTNLLEAKLGNEEGRAFIAARLADKVTDADTAVAKDAPKAVVVAVTT